MNWIVQYLWLIPALPLLAAGIATVLPRHQRTAASGLAIGSMGLAFLLSLVAFGATLGHGDGHGVFRQTFSFDWLQFGTATLKLGWVLDPLTAAMLVMVTFVGSLIFIFSTGYMAHDANFSRFFCFLSLFAAAMLGLIISNNLLLLFMCWEVVGLASYLLIGFWFHKPSAAAAAKKAFITTRIGDVGFFLGLLWLYRETGTLLCYDNGLGCLEASALAKMVGQLTVGGMAVSTAIALLIFCGAVGKSGQVPLHVWLPDAMEGPTPVSALIHAATMVAAGVFLVARVYPLMDVDTANLAGQSTALTVVTWIGAISALFAALIAVAQTDIKRILAYSTVSQLGFMMMGLGVGGVAVGIFHLITHAFFKALLFLGAGSVIHGCHEEQDIRRMGGLKRFMPVTFATYAVGMMALSGVPLVFSGFWSKDEILHAASAWPVSKGPFVIGLLGAVLTAFYMTRQMAFVFFGKYRGASESHPTSATAHDNAHASDHTHATPHESPSVMTLPLVVLATCAVLLSVVGTPAWPWFESYLAGHAAHFDLGKLFEPSTLATMGLSTLAVAVGMGLGATVYRGAGVTAEVDPIAKAQPGLSRVLMGKFFIDELYQATVLRLTRVLSWLAHAADRFLWNGIVELFSLLALGLAWVNRSFEQWVVNGVFDEGCKSVRGSARLLSLIQNGHIHRYLRVLAITLTALLLFLAWGCRS